MTARWAGRKGRPWRTLCAQVYAEETHCVRCGKHVDQTLPARTPQSRSVDHLTAMVEGGAKLSRENVGLAHLSCNSRHGARVRWALTKPQVNTPPRMIIALDPHTL